MRKRHLRSALLALSLAALLTSALPLAPLAHARPRRPQDAFKVILSTSHFGLQFLHAATDPQHPDTFTLTNGSALWYGLDIGTSPNTPRPVATDPQDDLVSSLLGQAGLLPPSDVIPINPDGTFFQNIKLKENFTAQGQQVILTLDPYTAPAVTLDILDLLLSLIGEQSADAVGLLQSGNLAKILTATGKIGDFAHLVSDFVALWHAVPQVSDTLAKANACIHDLLALFTNSDEVEALGKVMITLLGGVIADSAVTDAVQGFAQALKSFFTPLKLIKFIADLALSFGSYLFQEGDYPTVTLQAAALSAPNPTATPAPYATPTPAQETLYIGDGKGVLHAYNAATGRQQWSFQGDGATITAQAVVNGIVYATPVSESVNPLTNGTSYYPNPKLYALDAQSGKLLWQADGFFKSLSDGRVYLTSIKGDGALIAVDAITGTGLWNYVPDGSSSFSLLGSLSVVGTLYISSEVVGSDNLVHFTVDAINVADGSTLWQTDEAADGSSALALDNGRLYTEEYGSNSDLVAQAFDAATGATLWTKQVGVNFLGAGDVATTVGISAGHMYAIGLLSSGFGFAVFDEASGAQLWSAPCSPIQAFSTTSLYAVCSDQANNAVLTAFEPATGHPRWQKALGASLGGVFWSAVAADHVAFATEETPGTGGASTTFTLGAFNTSNGDLLWNHAGTYEVANGNIVAVLAADGTLDVVNALTGAPLWSVQLPGMPLAQADYVTGLIAP